MILENWTHLMFKRDWMNYFIIISCGIIVHGLLLLNDGIYWDDWLWVTALKGKNWSIIYSVGFERGVPFDSYFNWFFSYFKNIELAHRSVAFISILFAAGLIYAICNKLRILNKTDSLFIALISMVYPAFQTQMLLCTTNYLFYYMLFLIAVLVAFKSVTALSFTKYILRFASWIFFFISFSHGSLLVYFWGFVIIILLYLHDFKIDNIKKVFFNTVTRIIDYILLPFTYWTARKILFPPYGHYADVYKFVFSPEKWFLNLALFLYNGVYRQFNAALVKLITQPGLWLFVLLGVLFWYAKFKGDTVHPSETSETLAKPQFLLAYGFLLMGLGMLPYIAVGYYPTLTGWSTRHSLLLALPIALMLVALAHILFRRPEGGLSHIGWIFLTTLLLAFSIATVSNYIGWQARWVKDRSVMVNLARLDGDRDYSIYWVNDQYNFGGEKYRFYEWSSIFKLIWGEEKRIGYDLIYPDSNRKFPEWHNRVSIELYNLGKFDPDGRQATLNIYGRYNGSVIGLLGQYYYYRFLHPQRMYDFLIGVTEVNVLPAS